MEIELMETWLGQFYREYLSIHAESQSQVLCILGNQLDLVHHLRRQTRRSMSNILYFVFAL